MTNRRRKNDVDFEVDLHGYNAEEMGILLREEWPAWRGMRTVRLVHGRGDVLKPALAKWCEEMGIPFATEPNNPGSALLYPMEQPRHKDQFKTTLKDKGLSLTSEQEAMLRDPAALLKLKAEEHARRQVEEHKRRTAAQNALLKKRQDDAMFQAEMFRLRGMEKKGSNGKASGYKPSAPVVRPPSEIKHQEGWWNAELVRVADTDTETLVVQKRTGLEKLAPPVIAQKPISSEPTVRRAKIARDTAADHDLFEAALAEFDL